jgi:protease secretion system membrane fusion protein
MASFDWSQFASVQHPEAPETSGLPADLLDTRRPARVGFWTLAIGFGGFLLWAAFAPLDEGVPTQGVVALDTKRKAVQHLTGGIVKAVHVREGQFVEAGDPLIELDGEEAEADFESIRQRYFTLKASESRLLAERAAAQQLEFPEDLRAAGQSDPFAKLAMQSQQSLFASRRAALAAEIAALDEAISGHEASLRGYAGMLASRKTQLAYLNEELKGLRQLTAEGYAPRNQLLQLERSAAETSGFIADLIGNIERSKRAIAETQLRKAQREQEYLKEIDTQYADVRSQTQADKEALEAARDRLERTVIRAPAHGQIVGLTAQTVGGVIGAGEKLMDVVPQNESLLLETQVPPQMIDRVQAGIDADARFSAFAHTPQLVVPAKVDSISADLLTDPQTGLSYYLARVSVTPEGLQKLGGRHLQPGMPTEVVLITGERSMLTYLLRPLLKRIAFSLKEE